MPYAKEIVATPPPRTAGWPTAEVWEGPLSATSESDYALIASPAVPADTTPLDPDPVAFDLDTCELEVGLYLVRFVTASGVPSPFSAPVRSPAFSVASVWAPSTSEIAKLVVAYAREQVNGYGTYTGTAQAGRELSDFTENTKPTRTQAQAFIDAAVEEITGRVGIDPLPDRDSVLKLARQAATWHAAAQVEAMRQPSQADDATGTYRAFISNYTASLNALTDTARRFSYSLRLV